MKKYLFALALLLTSCGSAFAGSAYSAGTELYKQRKYSEAADAFISEVKHDPTELCCFKFGGRTDSYRTEIGEVLHAKFVLCTAYINKKLKEAQ